MFIASMGLVALGAAYMLSSAAHLAIKLGAGRGTRRAATLGVVLALATVLSLFTLLLFDALSGDHILTLGFMSLGIFPLLSGLLVAFTLVTAAYAFPWRWATTLVSVCYLALAGIMALFVQPATDWLLTVEHLRYRQAPPGTSIIALRWFLTPLVVALLIDIITRRARRKQWSQRKLILFLAPTALLSGVLPIMLIYPLLPAVLPLQLGIDGYLASVLLGLAGTYVGILFG